MTLCPFNNTGIIDTTEKNKKLQKNNKKKEKDRLTLALVALLAKTPAKKREKNWKVAKKIKGDCKSSKVVKIKSWSWQKKKKN